MPELPEVETIVNDLRPALKGAGFSAIETTHTNAVVCDKWDFDDLRGSRVLDVMRRGKFINMFFENDFVVTVHLRMSGRLLVREHLEEPLKFERTRLDFDRSSLRFCDMRKFGKVWLNKLNDYEEVTGIWRLGPEPFDIKSADFIRRLEGKKGVIKKWLLDQSIVAGCGNIYADEACFYAEIRPDARVEDLGEMDLEKLFKSLVKAFKQGIQNRGTSISDFADAYGKNGKNQELLYVYGRGGKDCLRCGGVLKKVRLVGRGTVYCEKCQG